MSEVRPHAPAPEINVRQWLLRRSVFHEARIAFGADEVPPEFTNLQRILHAVHRATQKTMRRYRIVELWKLEVRQSISARRWKTLSNGMAIMFAFRCAFCDSDAEEEAVCNNCKEPHMFCSCAIVQSIAENVELQKKVYEIHATLIQHVDAEVGEAGGENELREKVNEIIGVCQDVVSALAKLAGQFQFHLLNLTEMSEILVEQAALAKQTLAYWDKKMRLALRALEAATKTPQALVMTLAKVEHALKDELESGRKMSNNLVPYFGASDDEDCYSEDAFRSESRDSRTKRDAGSATQSNDSSPTAENQTEKELRFKEIACDELVRGSDSAEQAASVSEDLGFLTAAEETNGNADTASATNDTSAFEAQSPSGDDGSSCAADVPTDVKDKPSHSVEAVVARRRSPNRNKMAHRSAVGTAALEERTPFGVIPDWCKFSDRALCAPRKGFAARPTPYDANKGYIAGPQGPIPKPARGSLSLSSTATALVAARALMPDARAAAADSPKATESMADSSENLTHLARMDVIGVAVEILSQSPRLATKLDGSRNARDDDAQKSSFGSKRMRSVERMGSEEQAEAEPWFHDSFGKASDRCSEADLSACEGPGTPGDPNAANGLKLFERLLMPGDHCGGGGPGAEEHPDTRDDLFTNDGPKQEAVGPFATPDGHCVHDGPKADALERSSTCGDLCVQNGLVAEVRGRFALCDDQYGQDDPTAEAVEHSATRDDNDGSAAKVLEVSAQCSDICAHDNLKTEAFDQAATRDDQSAEAEQSATREGQCVSDDPTTEAVELSPALDDHLQTQQAEHSAMRRDRCAQGGSEETVEPSVICDDQCAQIGQTDEAVVRAATSDDKCEFDGSKTVKRVLTHDDHSGASDHQLIDKRIKGSGGQCADEASPISNRLCARGDGFRAIQRSFTFGDPPADDESPSVRGSLISPDSPRAIVRATARGGQWFIDAFRQGERPSIRGDLGANEGLRSLSSGSERPTLRGDPTANDPLKALKRPSTRSDLCANESVKLVVQPSPRGDPCVNDSLKEIGSPSARDEECVLPARGDPFANDAILPMERPSTRGDPYANDVLKPLDRQLKRGDSLASDGLKATERPTARGDQSVNDSTRPWSKAGGRPSTRGDPYSGDVLKPIERPSTRGDPCTFEGLKAIQRPSTRGDPYANDVLRPSDRQLRRGDSLAVEGLKAIDRPPTRGDPGVNDSSRQRSRASERPSTRGDPFAIDSFQAIERQFTPVDLFTNDGLATARPSTRGDPYVSAALRRAERPLKRGSEFANEGAQPAERLSIFGDQYIRDLPKAIERRPTRSDYAANDGLQALSRPSTRGDQGAGEILQALRRGSERPPTRGDRSSIDDPKLTSDNSQEFLCKNGLSPEKVESESPRTPGQSDKDELARRRYSRSPRTACKTYEHQLSRGDPIANDNLTAERPSTRGDPYASDALKPVERPLKRGSSVAHEGLQALERMSIRGDPYARDLPKAVDRRVTRDSCAPDGLQALSRPSTRGDQVSSEGLRTLSKGSERRPSTRGDQGTNDSFRLVRDASQEFMCKNGLSPERMQSISPRIAGQGDAEDSAEKTQSNSPRTPGQCETSKGLERKQSSSPRTPGQQSQTPPNDFLPDLAGASEGRQSALLFTAPDASAGDNMLERQFRRLSRPLAHAQTWRNCGGPQTQLTPLEDTPFLVRRCSVEDRPDDNQTRAAPKSSGRPPILRAATRPMDQMPPCTNNKSSSSRSPPRHLSKDSSGNAALPQTPASAAGQGYATGTTAKRATLSPLTTEPRNSVIDRSLSANQKVSDPHGALRPSRHKLVSKSPPRGSVEKG